MIKYLFSWEMVVATGLVLVSQTALRFRDGLGIGEVILALFIGFMLIQKIVSFKNRPLPKHLHFITSMLLFVVLVMLPVTIVNTYLGIYGSSLRDILAYLLSLLLIYTIASARLDYEKVGLLLCIFLLLICTGQYLMGGENAWYYGVRFTGGAKNPNQLGLYILSSLLMLSTITSLRNLWKFPIAGGLIFFGIITFSDALTMALLTILATFISIWLVPRKYLPIFIMFIGIPVMAGIYAVIFETNMLAYAFEKWESADEGGGRLSLYYNAYKAYISSPSAWPFGFGAGAFSGFFGPFERVEAHNTFLDFLTIGGIAGVYLLFAPILRALWTAYALNKHALASLLFGLVVFSMFHFVVRHPVFWVSLTAAIHALYSWQFKARQRQIVFTQYIPSSIRVKKT